MSWMDDWRAAEARRKEARQREKFDTTERAMTTADSMEDMLVAVMEQEEKYAGRWGFLDSLSNMGRKHDDGRPTKQRASTHSQRQRTEAGSGGNEPQSTTGEPPEQVA